MGELLLRKALSCRQRVAKIRAALPSTPEDVLRDERLEAFISFHEAPLGLEMVELFLDQVTSVIAEQ